MTITDLVRKHAPKHMGPVALMALVWIGTPFLMTLDEGMLALTEKARGGEISGYDYTRPWVKAALVSLAALGAFLDRRVEERRKKVESETQHFRDSAQKA